MVIYNIIGTVYAGTPIIYTHSTLKQTFFLINEHTTTIKSSALHISSMIANVPDRNTFFKFEFL